MYLEHGIIDDETPEVIQLSEDLNALDIHPERPDEQRWRNPNGAALKLANFAAFDPGYPGKGMTAGSKLDGAVFELLSPYPDLVKELAARVRDGERIALDEIPVDVVSSQPASSSSTTMKPPATSKNTASPPASSFEPVEQHHAKGKIKVKQTKEEREAERIEQPLVLRFAAFLNENGYDTGRWSYTFDGVTYYTDLVVAKLGLLIEAKAKVDRTSVRTGLGQLRDYDFMQSETDGPDFTSHALLLRSRPADSVLRMLEREDVGAVWPTEEGWAETNTASPVTMIQAAPGA